jgi:hypothetical protein
LADPGRRSTRDPAAKGKTQNSVSILVMLEPLPLGEQTNFRLTVQVLTKELAGRCNGEMRRRRRKEEEDGVKRRGGGEEKKKK